MTEGISYSGNFEDWVEKGWHSANLDCCESSHGIWVLGFWEGLTRLRYGERFEYMRMDFKGCALRISSEVIGKR